MIKKNINYKELFDGYRSGVDIKILFKRFNISNATFYKHLHAAHDRFGEEFKPRDKK